MTLMDWLITICLMLALLCGLFFAWFIFGFFQGKRKVAHLNSKNPKDEKKRKRWKKVKQYWQQKTKSRRNIALSLFLLSGVFAAISWSVYQVQRNTLSAENADTVAQGYYLLRDFESELQKAATAADNEEKIVNNLKHLANTISSYGVKRASTTHSEQGQITMNRYYQTMSELGVNALKHIDRFYNNPNLVKEYQNDLKKVQKYESKIIQMFRINEEALQRQK